MAHINLLPWREERRQERQQQFMVALVAGVIFAVAILYGAILFADDLLEKQQARNNYLKTEISKLDIKIREIKTLEEERARLIARMQVIQQLQLSRPKVVKVFDALVRTVPEGIHLDKVTRQGSSLTFNGVAQSNARVSVFMTEIDENPEFGESKLRVIQRTSTNDNAIRKFTLAVPESKPKTEEEEL
ncbi:MAG: PilN domain-containing protein [Gammaproteobacteria bacterium]|nr:PilN domain-containing protein [Gammaproteobacteria bacterium]